MKKMIAVFVTCILLASVVTAGAQPAPTTVETTETEIKITVELGADFAGREVGIELLNPKKTPADLVAADTVEKVKAALAYSDQLTADASGKATFVIAPTGEAAGYYTAYIHCKGSSVLSERIPFASAAAVAALISSLEAEAATAADAAALFAAPDTAETLAGHEVLGLSLLKAYTDIFSSTAYGTDAMKQSVYAELIAGLKGQDYNKEEVGAVFTDAVYRSVLYTLKDAAALLAFLEAYPAETGLSATKLYSSVYGSTDYISAAEKLAIAKRLAQYPWQSESGSEITAIMDEAIFMEAILTVSDGYGKIGELITLGQAVLTAAGADFTNYGTAKQESVWRAVAGKQTMSEFVTALNTAIAGNQTSAGGGASAGSSNRDNGGSAGGSVLAGSGTGSNLTESSLQEGFADIAHVDWAAEAISELYKKGYISGKAENLFYPDDAMTRSEFLKVLVLSLSLLDETAEANFEDVAKDSWYYPYVASAYSLGIVNGYGSTFAPDETISREQAAAMIFRCMGVVDRALPVLRDGISFTDFASISEYAREAVTKLYQANIINGMSAAEFAPHNDITRAQAVKMIYGLLSTIA